jgi:hypothetical protein
MYQQQSNALLQFCLIPRCMVSPRDALYCGRFLQRLHHIDAPGFNSIICFDKVCRATNEVAGSMTPGIPAQCCAGGGAGRGGPYGLWPACAGLVRAAAGCWPLPASAAPP